MHVTQRFVFICMAVVAAVGIGVTNLYASEYTWDGVERVVVVPDVHGAYPALVGLLETTGIIDAEGRWAAGDTHLVSLGDLLGRGPESRKAMDLLIRLQSEAAAAGGRVHVIAGNHELMNLIGDLRYVADEEFAAFSADETEAMRAERAIAGREYPPGYFAHRLAFRPDGYYGQWLLTLPAVIVINGIAYAHGGLPPIVASMSLDELNTAYHNTLTHYLELWLQLVADGVIPDDEAQDAGRLAQTALADAESSDCIEERAAACLSVQQTQKLQRFVELSESPLLTDEGTLWFRGSIYCRPMFERPALEAALTRINASRVFVGHTPSPDAQVHTMHGDRLMLLDTGMLVSHYKGRPAALVLEGDSEFVQYLDPVEKAVPISDLYPGTYTLSDKVLYEALQTGDVTVLKMPSDDEPWPVSIEHDGKRIKAAFIPEGRNKAASRELAAYRLNRMLGFDLVPMAVARDVANASGTLQLVYEKSLSEQQRIDGGRGVGGWCSLNRQLQVMYVWDLLIANSGRTSDNVLYQLPIWRLRLNDHRSAFGTGRRLPRNLAERGIELHPEMRKALTTLTQDTLAEQLDGLVDHKSIKSLLKRRDSLLRLLD